MTNPATTDPVADALRQALGAQYELLGILGRGGMGVVYRAREPFLQRDVAVKVLSGDLASGDGRERFLREARTAARLSHPNIVPLHTFGQAGDLLYYVMGFVDGESLEARLRRLGRLDADDTRRIMAELSDALEYAHQQGVVHRDVKPDNVLLDRQSGRAMLTDFGIARQRATNVTLTQTGVIVGTPHYMSPEQAAGDPDIDGRSDIYALGVIGYRMATGRLPFEGTSLQEVLAQHATRVPVAPTALVADVPPAIEHVITRALAKDPAARWPSAGAMHHALTSDGEGLLPESLESVAGMGPRLALIALGLNELSFVGSRLGWMDLTLTVATAASSLGVVAVGLTTLVSPARRHGFRAAWRQFWRQPTWWTGWWPRIGRRPGDLWDRLPAEVRRARLIAGIGTASNVLLLNGLLYGVSGDVLTAHPAYMKVYSWVAVGLVTAWLGTLEPLTRRFRKRAKAAGLTDSERVQVLSGATWGSFWQRPHVAALLESRRPVETRALPDDPAALVRQVRSLADANTSSPHADVYKEATAAAATIHAAIEALDAELAQLARDSDPRELERIQASIAALGARETGESAVKAQMRELLAQQEALFREIQVRREQLGARRAHLAEQLRTLVLHLANLRAAESPAASSEVTSRIRAICRDLEHRAAGEREVRELV